MTGIRPQEVGNFSEQVWGFSTSVVNHVDGEPDLSDPDCSSSARGDGSDVRVVIARSARPGDRDCQRRMRVGRVSLHTASIPREDGME
jgi:hypothetical protein